MQKSSGLSGRTLSKSTLAEQTYEVLKEQILDQALAPGARLNIDAISKELQVSSSPICEALARLEAEHLVVSALYSGYNVAPQPRPAYLHQLLDFRIVLEGACARIGADARDPEAIEALKKNYAIMAKTHRLGTRYQEYRKFVQADTDFHLALVNSAHNDVFSEVYAGMHAILLQSRLYLNRRGGSTSSQTIMNEHEEILTAFQEGNGRAAEKALQNHIENGRKRLLIAEVEEEPAPPKRRKKAKG